MGWIMATWPSERWETVYEIEPWDGFPTLDELITHYGERTSRNMDSIAWYGVLGCFKLGSILEGTHARAGAGKAPKETGDFLHAVAISLFGHAHQLVAEN